MKQLVCVRSALLLSFPFMMFIIYTAVKTTRKSERKSIRHGALISIAIHHCPNGIRSVTVYFSIQFIFGSAVLIILSIYFLLNFELETVEKMFHNNANAKRKLAKMSHNSFRSMSISENK